jgi:uncharacterized membrane protein
MSLIERLGSTIVRHRRDAVFVGLLVVVATVLLFVPTGFEQPELSRDSLRVRGQVVSADDGDLKQYGIIKEGVQELTIRILSGRFRGREVSATNTVVGKLEIDKVFRPGDRALVVLDLDETHEDIRFATAVDHYRIHVELVLVAAFVVLLVGFAGWTGIKAAFSFFFSALVIWKVMIPGFLRGADPVLLSLGVVVILTAAIVFLVAGLTRRGLSAFLGSLAGVVVTGVLSLVFGSLFRANGAVKPFTETLLYSGYANLEITRLFLAGVFLASSGAVMDLAVDIAAALDEVWQRRPELSFRELLRSGFRVGRAVTPTMTTTLLLAYSGGYTALLMVFMARGVPLVNLFNVTYVSMELLNTIVGSFGLVTVGPFTALIGAAIFSRSARGHSAPAP